MMAPGAPESGARAGVLTAWAPGGSPDLGQNSWPCTRLRRETGGSVLSAGQGRLPGMKAGNCKGKSETKKREKFFPARGHVPRQHRAKRGHRETAGREASRWRGGFRGRARSLQRSRGRAGGGPEVEPEGLVPRPVNPKECLGQQRGFPLEEGKLGGHVTQADLGSGPRASTCPCKSLLPFKPHFMQTVKWGWSYLPK